MSGSCGAAPEALDALACVTRDAAEQQRRIVRRVERALAAAGAQRPDVVPLTGVLVRSLRQIPAELDEVVGELGRSAAAFRAADDVLQQLGAATFGAAASTRWRWPERLGAEWEWRARYAEARADIGAGVRVDADGGFEVSRRAVGVAGYVETRVGAWARAAAAGSFGPLAAEVGGEVFGGARARAETELHIGRDGARARVGGEAFAGVQVDGEVGGEAGPFAGKARATAAYGAGGHIDGHVDATWDRVGGKFDVSAALGLGGGVGFEYYVEPKEVVDGVVQLGDATVRVAVDGAEIVGDGVGLVGDGLSVVGRGLGGLL